mmetsp:Transcript_19189/g.37966  ORF Transcript_19189/g.37966 Transcript_19189/m.37966 type:complete len:590 (-) Transcript_19189:25-1794(-)
MMTFNQAPRFPKPDTTIPGPTDYLGPANMAVDSEHNDPVVIPRATRFPKVQKTPAPGQYAPMQEPSKGHDMTAQVVYDIWTSESGEKNAPLTSRSEPPRRKMVTDDDVEGWEQDRRPMRQGGQRVARNVNELALGGTIASEPGPRQRRQPRQQLRVKKGPRHRFDVTEKEQVLYDEQTRQNTIVELIINKLDREMLSNLGVNPEVVSKVTFANSMEIPPYEAGNSLTSPLNGVLSGTTNHTLVTPSSYKGVEKFVNTASVSQFAPDEHGKYDPYAIDPALANMPSPRSRRPLKEGTRIHGLSRATNKFILAAAEENFEYIGPKTDRMFGIKKMQQTKQRTGPQKLSPRTLRTREPTKPSSYSDPFVARYVNNFGELNAEVSARVSEAIQMQHRMQTMRVRDINKQDVPKQVPKQKRNKDNVFTKLTDSSQYTGAHKHRFDANGRGKGLAGRDGNSGVQYSGGAVHDISNILRQPERATTNQKPSRQNPSNKKLKRKETERFVSSTEQQRQNEPNLDPQGIAKKVQGVLAGDKSEQGKPSLRAKKKAQEQQQQQKPKAGKKKSGGPSIFDRLTDSNQYTGAHKNRFDADG